MKGKKIINLYNNKWNLQLIYGQILPYFLFGNLPPMFTLNTWVRWPNQIINVVHLRYWCYNTKLTWSNNLRILAITKKISLKSWRKIVVFYSFPSVIKLVVKVTLSSFLTEKLSYLKHVRTQIIVNVKIHFAYFISHSSFTQNEIRKPDCSQTNCFQYS